VLDDVRSMYKSVNALLVQNAILPKIRYSVARSQDRKASPTGRGEEPVDAPPSDITTGAAQDLFTILQNLAASRAMAMGPQGAGLGMVAPGVPAGLGIPGMPGAAGISGVPGGAGIPGAPAGVGIPGGGAMGIPGGPAGM